MAMLALNEVFQQVWGEVLGTSHRLETEFWSEAIGRVKRERPGFIFLAEVYWGLEGKLQQLGFDFTYDKVLYDRLRFSTPADIRRHLGASDLRLERTVHFIENHDEPRAVVAFGRQRSLAAAVVLATVPGVRFFHDGQLQGRRIRLPVQMVREPKETADIGIKRFYDRLLAICNATAFHEGQWELIEIGQAREGNESYLDMLAWSWRYNQQFKIVAVNYSPNSAQGRLKVPLAAKAGRALFHDELTGTTYIRDSDELSDPGLYIELRPWRAHLFELTVR